MKNWIIGCAFLLISGAFFFRLHPYYISMTEMVFNATEKRMEIAVRVFTDDLEKELAADCHCKVDLLQKSDSLKNSGLLKSYLGKSLKIKVNKVEKKFSLIGFEKEEESIWTYLEFAQNELPKELWMENSLLFGTQPKQTNLVRLKVNHFDQTHQLIYPKREIRFDVKN